MAWMETDYSQHTHFRWKVKWRLKHLGALGTMGGTPLFTLSFLVTFILKGLGFGKESRRRTKLRYLLLFDRFSTRCWYNVGTLTVSYRQAVGSLSIARLSVNYSVVLKFILTYLYDLKKYIVQACIISLAVTPNSTHIQVYMHTYGSTSENDPRRQLQIQPRKKFRGFNGIRSTGFGFAVLLYDLYHTHIMSFYSYNRYKLNSHLAAASNKASQLSWQSIAQVSRTSWVRIALEPQNFFWTLFITAEATSQLQGSLSLVFFIRSALI